MRKYALALSLLLLVSGCARQTQEPTDKVYVPDEVPPVYVDLPDRAEKDADLVFSGWVTSCIVISDAIPSIPPKAQLPY